MVVAVIEDCLEDRGLLADLLYFYGDERSVLMELSFFDCAEDFLLLEDFSGFDLIFLDIFMDCLNGMQLARLLRSRGVSLPIVFVSSSSFFGVQSYEVRAFDYLLKPISYEMLCGTLDRVLEDFCFASRFIVIKCSREMRRVLVSGIVFVDYHNHYVQLHTDEGMLRTYMRFDEFELLLKDFKNFLTCFRCVMVNMDRVLRLDKGGFLMKDGTFLPINRKRFKEVKSIYLDYVFGNMGYRGV